VHQARCPLRNDYRTTVRLQAEDQHCTFPLTSATIPDACHQVPSLCWTLPLLDILDTAAALCSTAPKHGTLSFDSSSPRHHSGEVHTSTSPEPSFIPQSTSEVSSPHVICDLRQLRLPFRESSSDPTPHTRTCLLEQPTAACLLSARLSRPDPSLSTSLPRLDVDQL
jgi:hypothetical protein